MTTVTIIVSSVYDQVKLVLNGIPTGVTPINVVDGSEANSVYYMVPVAPVTIESRLNRFRGFGFHKKLPVVPDTSLTLTGEVLGNDEISIDGYSGTYYTVTVTDSRSQNLIFDADFEIVGETYALTIDNALSEAPVPEINAIPFAPMYANKAYVDARDAANLATAESYTDTHVVVGATPFPINIVNKTSSYTAAAGDFVKCDTSSGGFTVTLPLSASNAKSIVAIKKISTDANVLTLSSGGSDNIDGQISWLIVIPYTAIISTADGISTWEIY